MVKRRGFPSYQIFEESQEMGAYDYRDYKFIKNVGVPDYETARKLKISGFPDYKIYIEAITRGDYSYKEWLEITRREKCTDELLEEGEDITWNSFMDLMQFRNVAELLEFLEPYNIPLKGDLILFSTIKTRRAIDALLLKYQEAGIKKEG